MKSPKISGKCLACGSRLSEPLFVLDNMPVGAQAMPKKEELSKDRGVTLPLCRCKNCGLVQFDCEPVEYYRDAIRVVGLSRTMQDLRRKDYQHLIDKYGLAEKKWLECGCGNGDFLKLLAEFPVELYGTEAGEGNVTEAREKLLGAADESIRDKAEHGINKEMSVNECGTFFKKENIAKFFPENADMKIPGAPFDCFLSFNFLEHQPDPKSMLECIRNNLSEGGIGLITVPSFEYILENGRYYELIRDHIANYDMSSLKNLLTGCGFKVLEKGFIGIGDTIRMVVQKSELPDAPHRKISIDQNKKEEALRLNYLEMKKDIENYMTGLKKEGRSIALWGAGHQGFTIAATTALKEHAKYIIDSSDKKYGRFAPASHLPIVPPETYFKEPVDVIMIAAPGYIKEIEKTIREKYACENGPGVPAICDILDMRER